jgi:lysozyme
MGGVVIDKKMVNYSSPIEEGFSATPYRDTKGKLTIGYGFNLEDPTVRALIKNPNRISRGEAFRIWSVLMQRATKDAASFVGGEDRLFSMAPNRTHAVVDMAYNMGLPRLSGFSDTRKAILAKDWNRASKEILDSNYARKDVPARARRNALRMKLGGS